MTAIQMPRIVNMAHKSATIHVELRFVPDFGGWKARGTVRYWSQGAELSQDYWNGNFYSKYDAALAETLNDGSILIDSLL